MFEGRRQLIVYRAFFEPGVHGWPEHACIGCSLGADQVSNLVHLNARDTTLVYASRAPQADIARLKGRMGWENIPWYTITDSFDADFGVDEWHGHNAFIRDGERIFRTYLINSRGDEAMGTVWSYLDMTALGRQEMWEDFAGGLSAGARRTSGGTGTRATSPMPRLTPSGCRCRTQARPRFANVTQARRHDAAGVSDTRGDDEGVVAAPAMAKWLRLAATPTFAVMALLTVVLDSGLPNALCSAAGQLWPGRNGADVSADGGLSFGAMAEADLAATKR